VSPCWIAVATTSVRLSTPSRPTACAPRTTPSAGSNRRLQPQAVAAGVVLGVRGRIDVHLLQRPVGAPGVSLPGADGPDGEVAHLRDGRVENRVESGVPPGEDAPEDTARPVGRTAERHPRVAAGGRGDGGRVAEGVDVRRGGLESVVDPDRAGLVSVQPRRLGQFGARTHPGSEHDEVGP
jgi:hypothetical protein